jgi:hypothetical protein
MTWPWKRFVIVVSFGGITILLAGARDLSDALQGDVSMRPAVETMVAGMLCIGVVVGAVLLKNRRRWSRQRVERAISDFSGQGIDSGRPGHAIPGAADRDHYDDVIDDELTKL